MTSKVAVLRLEEPARFNPERLEQLCEEMGEVRAEHEVAQTLQSISEQVQSLVAFDSGGRPEDMVLKVRALAVAASKIGMATLARVAQDVLTCIAQRDRVALAATRARLIRVGERSIHAIWDLEDVSG